MLPVLCQVSGVHVMCSACCVAEQGSLCVVDSQHDDACVASVVTYDVHLPG